VAERGPADYAGGRISPILFAPVAWAVSTD